MNEPKLRFKGFEGEWEEKKLGEVMESYSGGTPSVGVKKYYDGDIPFIRSGEIHSDKTQLFITEEGLNNSSAKMVTKGTLLYALYGATSGDVAIAKIDGAINQAILAINPQPQYDSAFLENYLLKNKQSIIDTFLQGGQGNLSGQIVKNVDLIHPSLPEQRRIASYFTHLDTLIEASRQKVEKLKQVKAASLQSFFPTHGQRTPKIRFKGCEGEWNGTRIEEIFEIRNGYTPSKAVKRYWEGGTIPWFRMEDIRENGGILADAIQHITPLAVKGTGLFEKNSIILATTATIGVHAMLIAEALANQRFTNFSIRKSLSDKYDSKFVYYAFFGIDEWAKKNTNSGGLLAVNMPLLLKQLFYAPTLPEQRKIASYFTHLDTLLTLERQRYAKLQQVKRASLTQMFA